MRNKDDNDLTEKEFKSQEHLRNEIIRDLTNYIYEYVSIAKRRWIEFRFYILFVCIFMALMSVASYENRSDLKNGVADILVEREINTQDNNTTKLQYINHNKILLDQIAKLHERNVMLDKQLSMALKENNDLSERFRVLDANYIKTLKTLGDINNSLRQIKTKMLKGEK